MANKKSTTSEKTNIRRIKASDETPKKVTKPKADAKKVTKNAPVKKKKTDINEATNNPFVGLGNYFRGAWHELKQVRWPTRSATWSMTLAVLIFSAIFVVFILLLDYAFNELFEQLLS